MNIIKIRWRGALSPKQLAALLATRDHTQLATKTITNNTGSPTAEVDPSTNSPSQPPATITTVSPANPPIPEGSVGSPTDKKVKSCTVVHKVTSVRGSDPTTGGEVGVGAPLSRVEKGECWFGIEIGEAAWVLLAVVVVVVIGVVVRTFMVASRFLEALSQWVMA
ncbi:hypothetical protein B0T26DRAFT_676239 [Lasiosphaeria miniovina]|uniref:Uncharacterized protein n=1 Tax=Lasiosphaeria miniovina TaxID=1954250 RepID=A0AA40ALF5_9PEZI|nr:uncharacterized protein B0T26DRAFT_676239 [Lasiosphaeria miniovina]KAK0718013.1 hypothetical protein B0T26DRAFT_676239 [Lasiosphaeria miniovina]